MTRPDYRFVVTATLSQLCVTVPFMLNPDTSRRISAVCLGYFCMVALYTVGHCMNIPGLAWKMCVPLHFCTPLIALQWSYGYSHEALIATFTVILIQLWVCTIFRRGGLLRNPWLAEMIGIRLFDEERRKRLRRLQVIVHAPAVAPPAPVVQPLNDFVLRDVEVNDTCVICLEEVARGVLVRCCRKGLHAELPVEVHFADERQVSSL